MDHPIDMAAPGIVEKLILGATPDDAAAFATARGAEPGPQSARLARVRTYLASQPAFRAELEQQIAAAWQGAGGERAKYQGALAEQRARLLSLATAAAAPPPLQQLASDFERELSRYLVEQHGASGDEGIG